MNLFHLDISTHGARIAVGPLEAFLSLSCMTLCWGDRAGAALEFWRGYRGFRIHKHGPLYWEVQAPFCSGNVQVMPSARPAVALG